ncbi:MAG: septum formation initiator family protein [Firmicutes bacterium]|nr:septum formation initiator family protein [Bacillota bacterium]
MRLCKSSLITKLVILTVMIYAIVTIVTLQPKINALKAEKEVLSEEVAALQQSNLELQEDIAQLGTDVSVLKIARERLNLVSDGEVIYIDSSK